MLGIGSVTSLWVGSGGYPAWGKRFFFEERAGLCSESHLKKEGTSGDFWENSGIALVVRSWVWREEVCPGWDRLLQLTTCD